MDPDFNSSKSTHSDLLRRSREGRHETTGRVTADLAMRALGRLPARLAITEGSRHVLTYVSDAFTRDFGGDSLVGGPADRAFPPQQRAAVMAALDRVFATGEPYRMERVRALNATGTHRSAVDESCAVALEPVTTLDGTTVGVLIFVDDDSALDHDAERLLELQGRVLRSMREGVSVSDENGMVVYTNPAEDAMFGYAPGELVGRHISAQTALSTRDGVRLVARVAEELRTAGVWTGERRNRRKDGSVFVTQARITALELDGRTYWVCVEEDVTERRRVAERSVFLSEAAKRLGESLERRDVLEALARVSVPFLADLAIVDVVDEGGRLEVAAVAHRDPAAERLLRDAFRTDSIALREFLGINEVVRTREPFLVRTLSEEMLETIIRDRAGLEPLRSLQPRSYLCVPLESRGAICATLTLVTAESSRHYSEEDLRLALELAGRAATAVENATLHASTHAAREEAERANRAKSDLLAHASHDLRTPLNAISGYAELLEMELLGPVTETQRDAIERIQRSQRHLLALINDLLNFSKLESGTVDFDLAPVDVGLVISEVASVLAQQAAAKQLSLSVDAPRGIKAWTDSEKLFQILLNLLRNAVKFTAPGGSVRVSLEERGDAVVVAVSDTGVGIPSDKMQSIFEPFTQLGRSFNRPQEGSGLGLAISRELTRAMRGELTVTSEPGVGSTFTLTLPAPAAAVSGA